MGFSRIELETLSILDSHIDAATLHNCICSVMYPFTSTEFLFNAMPDMKEKKSSKRFDSATSAENYIKEPIVGRYK